MNQFHNVGDVLELLRTLQPSHPDIAEWEDQAGALRKGVEAKIDAIQQGLRLPTETLLTRIQDTADIAPTFREFMEQSVPFPSRNPELINLFARIREHQIRDAEYLHHANDKSRWDTSAKALLIARTFIEHAFDGELLSTLELKKTLNVEGTIHQAIEYFRTSLPSFGCVFQKMKKRTKSRPNLYRIERLEKK